MNLIIDAIKNDSLQQIEKKKLVWFFYVHVWQNVCKIKAVSLIIGSSAMSHLDVGLSMKSKVDDNFWESGMNIPKIKQTSVLLHMWASVHIRLPIIGEIMTE